mgnify:CR=1 FL=1
MTRIVTMLALGAALGGCGLNGVTSYPYVAGLIWTTSEDIEVVETTFRRSGAGSPQVAETVIGAAESCGDAQTVTGGTTVKGSYVRTVRNEVVGNTPAHHPIKPGPDGFNGIGVSVIAETAVEDGVYDITTSTTSFDEDGDLRTVDETVKGHEGRETATRYHGVAADEYIISLFPFDMWASWEDDDEYNAWDDAESDEVADEIFGSQSFFLLSKTAPKKGDIWMSTNGNILYVFDGMEKLDVGGKNTNAYRIKVYTVGNFDAEAGDVITSCLIESPFEYTSTDPDVDALLTSTIALDPGCEDRFVHQEIGTEWWANNALVKFEGRRVWVEVRDYGYEWFVDEEDFCVRMTSRTKPTDEPGAVPYIEYTVALETSSLKLDSWEEASKK